MSIFQFVLLSLLSLSLSHPSLPTTLRGRFPCPCVCRSGPMREKSTAFQCSRPRFMNQCVQSPCMQDNPRMSPGFWCCDPTPTPTPTPTPAPLPCPCICRTGANQLAASTRECALESTPDRCVVSSCIMGRGMGTTCCDEVEEIEECPCKCRTGGMALIAGQNECDGDVPMRCVVKECEKGSRSGFECCDP